VLVGLLAGLATWATLGLVTAAVLGAPGRLLAALAVVIVGAVALAALVAGLTTRAPTRTASPTRCGRRSAPR
jgi:hypothetical protein